MSLRFLLYQTRLIMTNEVEVFLWWGGKTDGQSSDQISLISSRNQFKSSGVTKTLNLQKTAEQNTNHRKADMNFAYNLSLKAKVQVFYPTRQLASHILIPIIMLSALQTFPNESIMKHCFLKKLSARKTGSPCEAFSSVLRSFPVFTLLSLSQFIFASSHRTVFH